MRAEVGAIRVLAFLRSSAGSIDRVPPSSWPRLGASGVLKTLSFEAREIGVVFTREGRTWK